MDWPFDLPGEAGGILTNAGPGSPLYEAVLLAGSQFTGTNNLTANLIVASPIVVPKWTTVYGLGWINGGTVSGNVDCGILDAVGRLVVHTGSTAQTPISVPQVVNAGTGSMVATNLSPGTYYLAIQQDNATGLLQGTTIGSVVERLCGCRQASPGAFPIPASPILGAFGTVGTVPAIFANTGTNGVF